MKKEFYTMKIAGFERNLPVCKLNDSLCIAAFVLFGDVELTVAAASELIKLAPPFDIIITPESKDTEKKVIPTTSEHGVFCVYKTLKSIADITFIIYWTCKYVSKIRIR